MKESKKEMQVFMLLWPFLVNYQTKSNNIDKKNGAQKVKQVYSLLGVEKYSWLPMGNISIEYILQFEDLQSFENVKSNVFLKKS